MNVADRTFRTIALFAGAGMLDEGLRAGIEYLGGAHRTVCYVEREAYAAGVLAARMEEGSLAVAPVWSDVTTFDGRRWRGSVDCLAGGFPCQDLSVAGRRAGLDGSRSGLFFEILRIADDCGAQWLFLENVGGIASATAAVVDEAEGELEERACARVLGELADRGWNAEWLTLSAGDVGASHKRERWFCLAWRAMDDAQRLEFIWKRVHAGPRPSGSRAADIDRAGAELDDAQGDARRTGSLAPGHRGTELDAGNTDHAMADTGRQRNGAHEPEPVAGCRCEADDCTCGSAVADAECAQRRPDAFGGIRQEQGRDAGREETGRLGNGDEVLADASSPGRQGRELGGACNRDRGGGRKHMDQLANFVAYSPQAQPTRDGPQSSPITPASRRRLNPVFVEWLMGWRLNWTAIEPHACGSAATALWRRRLAAHLSCLLDGAEQ